MEAPVLLIRGRSLFPGSLLRLSVARQRSMALVDERLAANWLALVEHSWRISDTAARFRCRCRQTSSSSRSR